MKWADPSTPARIVGKRVEMVRGEQLYRATVASMTETESGVFQIDLHTCQILQGDNRWEDFARPPLLVDDASWFAYETGDGRLVFKAIQRAELCFIFLEDLESGGMV